jgi:hypothetical protein
MISPLAGTDPVAVAPGRWPLGFQSETATSDHASASCYRGSENVEVMPVVVAELKFRDVGECRLELGDGHLRDLLGLLVGHDASPMLDAA